MKQSRATEVLILLGAPIAAFLVPLWLACSVAQAESYGGSALLWALWAVFTLTQFFGIQSEANLYEFMHFLMILGIGVPAFFGLALGGFWGWPRK